MDNLSQDLSAFFAVRLPIMVHQLHEFCAINSGTANLAGLQTMHRVLSNAFKPLACRLESKPLPAFTTVSMKGELIKQQCGEALFIQKRPDLPRRILLAGHMDTVYGKNSAFTHLTYLNDNQINGPGVADMKGGLIVMLHALEAFEKLPAASSLGWDVLITADEEIGSPASSKLFADMAHNYQTALVYEPTMNAQGTLAKNRKGSAKITIVATGKAAHAGRAFAAGRNAICFLAEVITAIDKLNGIKEGVTVNVGKIAGGEALNAVPEKAVAKLDIRVSLKEDEQWVMHQLQQLIQKFIRQDYSLTLHGNFGRPVKRVNHTINNLYNRIKNIGQGIGLNIDWEDSGGCCDGNNLAHLGLPVIDTLGVRGGNLHSPEEYILLDSLAERALLSTLLLNDLASGGLEELAK